MSVFYQIGTDDAGKGHGVALDNEENGDSQTDEPVLSHKKGVRRAQEHEFRIGCVGVGDTMGILVASLVAMPLELALCDAQVRRGRSLCKQV